MLSDSYAMGLDPPSQKGSQHPCAFARADSSCKLSAQFLSICLCPANVMDTSEKDWQETGVCVCMNSGGTVKIDSQVLPLIQLLCLQMERFAGVSKPEASPVSAVLSASPELKADEGHETMTSVLISPAEPSGRRSRASRGKGEGFWEKPAQFFKQEVGVF